MSKSKKHAASRRVSKSTIPFHRSLVVRKEFWPVVVVASLVLVAFVQTVVQASTLSYDKPEDASYVSSRVLGDDDQDEESEEEDEDKQEDANEEEKRAEEEQREAEKKAEEQRVEQERKDEQVNSAPSVRRSTQISPDKSRSVNIQRDGRKIETEFEAPDGTKFKTKTEDDGTSNVELEQGGLKIKYKVVNGEVQKVVVDEEGEEIEVEKEDEDELEAEIHRVLEDEGIELSTESGRPKFSRNNVAARTNFPLSIDSITHQLIVTTQAGSKVVAVLPDEAVQAVLKRNIITTVDSSLSDGLATDSANTEVELQVVDGEPVYEVKGTREYKLFAFLPVKAQVKALVSAETGLLVGTQKSFYANFIDLLSP